MLQNLTGWHALIILAIILLLFGAAKLPELAKSVGQSMRILKDETRDDTPESNQVVRAPAAESGESGKPIRSDDQLAGPTVSAVPRNASESMGA